jgi:hypothetical protein
VTYKIEIFSLLQVRCVYVYVPIDFVKSSGQAANKLATCEFSKWKHAVAYFEKRQKENYHVNSVSVYEKFLD